MVVESTIGRRSNQEQQPALRDGDYKHEAVLQTGHPSGSGIIESEL
jgi:hypothetical protein